LRISLVTVVYNAEATIARCIESVIGQKYTDLEYIIIDGGSTDNTLQIIDKYRTFIDDVVSEPDHGIYDAMNKAIRRCTGQIVGTLNADDRLADGEVLFKVAQAFEQLDIAIVYGNLEVVNRDGRIIRKWISKPCVKNSFNRGFMPPHPTFYCRRDLFEKVGFYSLDYGSAADYELMLRFMYAHKAKSYYLNTVMVTMLSGGVSNRNLQSRLDAWKFDLKAMRQNRILFPVLALIMKPLRKIFQFF
jgi:glycosyltransferase involved in cell wall biosynthesis